MNISRLSIIKFLELLLTVTCVGLHSQSFNVQTDIGMIVTGTFIGYLILFAGAAAGYLLQTPTPKRIDVFYSLVGVVMFVTSGALLVDRFQGTGRSELGRYNLAKGSLAIINGAILLVDAVLTHRGG